MNLEHRLHHAARELREVTIDVPPLGTRPTSTGLTRRTRLVPALAAPLLFAAGALFAVGAVRGVERPMHSDIGVTGGTVGAVADTDVVEGPIVTATSERAAVPAVPSIHEELELISEFLAATRTDAPAGDGEPAVREPGSSSVGGVGPI